VSGRWPGHSVLAVPVPALDDWVRERTRGHDPAWVSTDPGFVHAHVTVLGPWLPAPTDGDLDRVAALLSAVPAFDAELADAAVFPDGLVHLRPEPVGAFTSLTSLLAAAYPQCPPYEGRYADVVPHLSLDQVGARGAAGPVTREQVLADVAPLLPARTRVDRVDLQWWQADGCRLLRSFPLAPPAARAGA
jgi:hypothetical protein